jgi:hypothetical protein
VLHVGRRSRTVPAAVRRALNLRDRGCQGPGCTMPPGLCTPHHWRHWADGGSHDLPNLALHCSTHHARLHPENDRFRRGVGQPAAVPARAPCCQQVQSESTLSQVSSSCAIHTGWPEKPAVPQIACGVWPATQSATTPAGDHAPRMDCHWNAVL